MNLLRKPETVSSLTAKIKGVLENSFSPGVWVEGEVSNLRVVANSGHAYFSLKDSYAQISCVCFRFTSNLPRWDIKDGEKIRIHGDVTVYEQRGNYQILVRSIERAGLGELMIKLEELKQKLKAEGLFDREKRPIPIFPRKIGIVTSPTGAAIRDMLSVTRRRFANLHIIIAPALVQGTGASRQIAAGIKLLNSMAEPPDVIIVGRGGGSIEDLWCFNEEEVARSIFASAIPVISAVGHETDVTISDWVADVRAPTPSAAAELVVGRKEDFEGRLEEVSVRIMNAMRNTLLHARSRVEIAAGSHVFRKPENLVFQQSQRLDFILQKMESQLRERSKAARSFLDALFPRMSRSLESSLKNVHIKLVSTEREILHLSSIFLRNRVHQLGTLTTRLETLNPDAVLSRGYAILENEEGDIIKSASQPDAGETVIAKLRDGELRTIVVGNVAEKKKTKKTRKIKNDISSEQPLLF
ncbi:MAG: exodeoxyribonuclease VII large subunit [Lentisphaerae bacterium]|jgi:exodeoxyribonuclease VII large subunit|nr:exodeoxyribonuclease VII large subunit [Lentisphaerota bacterium]